VSTPIFARARRVVDGELDVIAIEPPKGTPPPAIGELLDDVRMAEEETPPMLSPPEEDVKMAEEEKVHEERAVEATVNECAMETDIVKEETKLETDQDVVVDDEPTPKDEHDQDDERPTKRARRSSNADEESIIAVRPVLCSPSKVVLIIIIQECNPAPSYSKRRQPYRRRQ
jgi:bromodomain-containing factor 1